MLETGITQQLTVIRETDLGFMLYGDGEEVLLHHKEAVGEVVLDQEVEVFLYSDPQGRLTATMSIPEISVNHFAWVTVTEVNEELGLFVDIGIAKEMLIHKGDLSPVEDVWPQVGDKLYCTLKRTRQGRLITKLATTEDMKEIMTPATEEDFNKNVEGVIYRTLRVGSYIYTDEGFLGFIHHSERGATEPRIGARVSGRIIDVKEDGEINVSLRPRKHEGQVTDAVKIYAYMEERGGAMPFSDKSAPEDIFARFAISKAAFKRALGKLMKEEKVYQEDGWTYFRKEEENE